MRSLQIKWQAEGEHSCLQLLSRRNACIDGLITGGKQKHFSISKHRKIENHQFFAAIKTSAIRLAGTHYPAIQGLSD
jgi:calcineurin-like phosphoesterase family protein